MFFLFLAGKGIQRVLVGQRVCIMFREPHFSDAMFSLAYEFLLIAGTRLQVLLVGVRK